MKAKIVTLALAAGMFALVACKPKADNTEKKEVNADQVAEGVSEIIDVATEEVEPIPGEVAPAEPPAVPAPE